VGGFPCFFEKSVCPLMDNCGKHAITIFLTRTNQIPVPTMEIGRLYALLVGLVPHLRKDLMAFLQYRGCAEAIPGRLLQYLLSCSTSPSREQIVADLNIKPASLRTGKSELEKHVLEWFSINATQQTTTAMYKLGVANIFLQWNQPAKAMELARKAQELAQHQARYDEALVALRLQLDANRLQATDDVEKQDVQLRQELEQLQQVADTYAHLSSLYEMARSAHEEPLAATNGNRQELLSQCWKGIAEYTTGVDHLPYPCRFAYHHTVGLLYRSVGNMALCYQHLRSTWVDMERSFSANYIGEKRFHSFFLLLIDASLRADDPVTAYDIIQLTRLMIETRHGNDPRLQAQMNALQSIVQLHFSEPLPYRSMPLADAIAAVCAKTDGTENDFDPSRWEPIQTVIILPLLYDACVAINDLRGRDEVVNLLQRWQGPETPLLQHLQALAPLAALTIACDHALASRKKNHDCKNFHSLATSCYHRFQKLKTQHPVEWEMARLFNGLASGRKPAVQLFEQCLERLNAPTQDATYTASVALLFDLQGWATARHHQLTAKVAPSGSDA
jgi:hypothetical protein